MEDIDVLKTKDARCKSEGKECRNCGHKRPGTCWYMRCWRGYYGGDQDNWIPETETDVFKEIEKNSWGNYSYSEKDDKFTIGG